MYTHWSLIPNHIRWSWNPCSFGEWENNVSFNNSCLSIPRCSSDTKSTGHIDSKQECSYACNQLMAWLYESSSRFGLFIRLAYTVSTHLAVG